MSGRIINKLIVDRDGINNVNDRTIHIYNYPGRVLRNRDLRKLVDVIYNNFLHLRHVTGIYHTRLEITKLLTSNNSMLILAIHNDNNHSNNNNNIVGYILGDMVINNMKPYMHIYYFYTSPYFRGKGIGTYILNMMHEHAKELNINTLSLTYDTYDKPLTKYYLDNKFNYSDELRSYQRYDMLVKYI